MSAQWKGKLLNTRTDVLIDSTIVILIICAYVPQLVQLLQEPSTRGVSAYYILFSVLFSNTHLSELLLCAAYAWPTAARPVLEQISRGSLKGLYAIGAILGLLLVFVQWASSIAVLVAFAASSQLDGLTGRNISIIALLHAVVVLFPAVANALPRPSPHDFGMDVIMALVGMSNLVVAPCFVVLQFYAQLREMRSQNWTQGALSLLSIGIQVPAIGLVASRWFLRLGKPAWGYVPAPVWFWCQWSFPAANYLLHALGCCILLICYSCSGTAGYSD